MSLKSFPKTITIKIWKPKLGQSNRQTDEKVIRTIVPRFHRHETNKKFYFKKTSFSPLVFYIDILCFTLPNCDHLLSWKNLKQWCKISLLIFVVVLSMNGHIISSWIYIIVTYTCNRLYSPTVHCITLYKQHDMYQNMLIWVHIIKIRYNDISWKIKLIFNQFTSVVLGFSTRYTLSSAVNL